MPSRQLFEGRQWPEGYVFPACRACNSGTSHDEQLFALLVRLYPDAEGPGQMREMEQLFQAIRNNAPQLLREMQPNTREVRKFLRNRGVPKPLDKFCFELPILSVKGPIVARVIETVGVKLACALHYFHAGKIVPSTGAIGVMWFTNVQLMEQGLPPQLLQILGPVAELRRAKTTLNDQFSYRYRVTDDGRMGVFLMEFRRSFALLAWIHIDETRFPSGEDHLPILKPRKPAST